MFIRKPGMEIQYRHFYNIISKSIGIICKSTNILSKRLMKQLYFLFVYSYLKNATYCLDQYFIFIKNMHLGLIMKRTVLHRQNFSLNMQKH